MSVNPQATGVGQMALPLNLNAKNQMLIFSWYFEFMYIFFEQV